MFGAYYYLFIFPFFYSLKFFEVKSFDSFDLTLASIASILAIFGYKLGNKIYLLFGKKYLQIDIGNSPASFDSGIGSRKIDIYLIFIILFFNLSIILVSEELRNFFIISSASISFIFIHQSRLSRFLKNVIILSIVFLSLFASLVLTTSRTDLIETGILLAFLFLFLERKAINYSYLLTLGIFICFGALYITIYRTWIDFDDINYGFFEGFSVLFESYDNFLLIILALGDIGIAYDNLIYLIKNTEFETLLFGITLIRPIFFLVPRTLWESKPLDTQTLIVEERFGTGLSEFGGGTSQSITLVGDFFWNFSYVGVFLGFVFLAALISWLDKILFRCQSSSLLIILSLFAPFFFIIWRGAYSSSLIYTFISLTPLLFLISMHSGFKEIKPYPRKLQ